MVAYFSCGNVRVKHYNAGGLLIQFTPVSAEMGVIAVNDDGLIGELRSAIKAQVGGYAEVSEAEYRSLKKNSTSSTPWREELGKTGAEANRRPVIFPPMTSLPQSGDAAGGSGEGAVSSESVSSGSAGTPMAAPKAVKKK